MPHHLINLKQMIQDKQVHYANTIMLIMIILVCYNRMVSSLAQSLYVLVELCLSPSNELNDFVVFFLMAPLFLEARVSL
jgi:hypothetical protein